VTPELADPLRPSPDEAREQLQRELLNPEYQRDDWLERVVGWLQGLFDDGVGAASGVPGATTFALIVVFLLLTAGILALASRVRGSARQAARREAVLPDERVPASEYRRRADAAFAEGRYADAVVEGFRAVAARQVERGRLEDLPGATAHEIADRLAVGFGERAPLLQRVAQLFDEVRYGDRPASSADARSVLSLDEDLAGVR
jgi:hypothetical protein